MRASLPDRSAALLPFSLSLSLCVTACAAGDGATTETGASGISGASAPTGASAAGTTGEGSARPGM